MSTKPTCNGAVMETPLTTLEAFAALDCALCHFGAEFARSLRLRSLAERLDRSAIQAEERRQKHRRRVTGDPCPRCGTDIEPTFERFGRMPTWRCPSCGYEDGR